MSDELISKLLTYFYNNEERARIFNKCFVKLKEEFDCSSSVACLLVAYFVCEFTEGSEQARWRDGK